MILSSGRRAALMALVLVACSPTLDWRDVRVDDAALIALFPCRPERRARPVSVAASIVRMEMASCAAGDETFAVGFFDVADPAAVGPALEALRSAAVRNIAATAPAMSPYALRGMTPNPLASRIDAAGHRPDGTKLQVHAAFFARGLRVYQASVIGAAPTSDSVTSFIGGLKLAS